MVRYTYMGQKQDEREASAKRMAEYNAKKAVEAYKFWNACKEKVLNSFTYIIKHHPQRMNDKWIEALPEMRKNYKAIRDYDDYHSKGAAQRMCTLLNQFNMHTKVELKIFDSKKLVGEYQVPDRSWVSFQRYNTFPKPDEALSIIKDWKQYIPSDEWSKYGIDPSEM